MYSKLINLRIDLELYEELKNKAKDNGLTLSSYIRFILKQYLKKRSIRK